LLSTRAAGQQPYSTARYSDQDGVLFVYQTSGIAVIGFETAGLFDYAAGLPRLGNVQAQVATDSVFGIFDIAGLPAGLFNLGTFLPTGLSPSDFIFTYTPKGSQTTHSDVDAGPAEAAASVIYNHSTGELTVQIVASAQALLIETPDLFNTATTPHIGALAPSQFDASNLMFFNNDAPLPTGTFNLGAVLPPGLNASQISLATKGNGIAVGIPVTVVPEGATASVATILAAFAFFSTRPYNTRRRKIRRN
jgi:hypothetical protein